jgi:hypothetical protein
MADAGWFTEWGIFTKEWVIGAFCSATLDWMVSKVPVRPGIIATLLSTAQLATSVSFVYAISNFFGKTTTSQFMSDNWFLFNVIWMMSPTATSRLMSSYARFHRILYGSAPLPEFVSGKSCADGKCKQ